MISVYFIFSYYDYWDDCSKAIDKDYSLKYTDIDKFLNEQLRKQKISYHKTYANLNVNRVIEIEGEDQAYKKLIFLNEDEIDCSELLLYLQKY